MALGSQLPREGMSRRHMTTSRYRRRSRRWIWLLVVILGVGLGIWYLTTLSNTPDAPEVSDTTGTSTDANQSGSEISGQNGNTGTSLYPATDRFASNTNPDDRTSQAASRVPTIPGTSAPGSDPLGGNPSVSLGNGLAPSSGDMARGESPNVTSSRTSDNVASEGRTTSAAGGGMSSQLAQGFALIEQGKLVEGRALLSELLFAEDVRLTLREQQRVREVLSGVNNMLIFSRDRVPNDDVTRFHEIKRGDSYARIAPNAKVPHEFLQMINQVPPNRLQVGQSLKVVEGPFHARVYKSQYLLDVYLENAQGKPIYITTFPVGLGEDDSTPVGRWVVTPGRKVKNPSWRNPRTGDFYPADHPENPIGEHWIALSGVDENTANRTGYGIHGTIEPDSIGDQQSMGCIRLRNEDVALLYNMLESGHSTVKILP